MSDPWEQHAAWWQDGFTDGADAEYVEQILPLAADHLSGCERVLDIGAGEGQVARSAAAGGASPIAVSGSCALSTSVHGSTPPSPESR